MYISTVIGCVELGIWLSVCEKLAIRTWEMVRDVDGFSQRDKPALAHHHMVLMLNKSSQFDGLYIVR